MNEPIKALAQALDSADAVLVGAGAGLSSAAGFDYAGERLLRYFPDFVARYGFEDMYSGGFYPFPSREEYWAYWSRYIYINRYMDAPVPVYRRLLDAVSDKDYFVITTNVDHYFQKAGIDKNRLFYTQGDYGLWQCSVPCHDQTYDNYDTVLSMVRSQGFEIGEGGVLVPPDSAQDAEMLAESADLESRPTPHVNSAELKMSIPSHLVPFCPKCGAPMTMNLRADDRFVEDGGWRRAAESYHDYCDRHRNAPILLLEIGVGYNTPGIIKYPFLSMTAANDRATYVIINRDDARFPAQIDSQTIAIQGDVADVLSALDSFA